MKKTKKLLGLCVILSLLLSLAACGKAKLQGSWSTGDNEDVQYTFTFNDDGTGSMSFSGLNALQIKYSTDNDKLTIEYTILGEVQKEEFTYELSKDKLTLTQNGESVTLEKK